MLHAWGEFAPGGEREVGQEFEEGRVFEGAGGAEAGADLGEVGVEVAGVADEFPDRTWAGSGRDGGEEGAKGAWDIASAGGEDSQGAVGSGESSVAGEAEEGAVLGVEGDDGEAAEQRSMVGGAERPGGFEGIADGGDSAGAGGLEEGAEDAGEEVGVLVGIDMGDAKAGSLEASDLGGGFGGDFFGADAEGEEVADEVSEGRPQLAAGGYQGRDLAGGKNGGAVDEKDVAANFEGGVVVGAADGIVKEGAGGHEGGGGEGAGGVEFDDGAIDAGGEAEVVSVDEEHLETGYREVGTGCRVRGTGSW
jgi:hypothetical protein